MGNNPTTGKAHKVMNEKDAQQSEEQGKPNPVMPYREGASIQTESRLKDFIKRAGKSLNDDEDAAQISQEKLKKYKEDQHNLENIQKETLTLENQFPKDKLEKVRDDFEAYSKENKMSRKKFLEYFGMADLDNKRLGNRLFQCSKSTFSQKKTGPFLDYPKFLKTIAMIHQQGEEGRLRFLYSMFDQNLDGTIEKDEMYNLMMMFLEGMMSVNYENNDLNELKQKISESPDRQIELALEDIVNEVFTDQSKSLSFDEWQKWLKKQEGIEEILKYEPKGEN